jgi:hypothetical protein
MPVSSKAGRAIYFFFRGLAKTGAAGGALCCCYATTDRRDRQPFRVWPDLIHSVITQVRCVLNREQFRSPALEPPGALLILALPEVPGRSLSSLHSRISSLLWHRGTKSSCTICCFAPTHPELTKWKARRRSHEYCRALNTPVDGKQNCDKLLLIV